MTVSQLKQVVRTTTSPANRYATPSLTRFMSLPFAGRPTTGLQCGQASAQPAAIGRCHCRPSSSFTPQSYTSIATSPAARFQPSLDSSRNTHAFVFTLIIAVCISFARRREADRSWLQEWSDGVHERRCDRSGGSCCRCCFRSRGCSTCCGRCCQRFWICSRRSACTSATAQANVKMRARASRRMPALRPCHTERYGRR